MGAVRLQRRLSQYGYTVTVQDIHTHTLIDASVGHVGFSVLKDASTCGPGKSGVEPSTFRLATLAHHKCTHMDFEFSLYPKR